MAINRFVRTRLAPLLALAVMALPWAASCGGNDDDTGAGEAPADGPDAATLTEAAAGRMEELESFHFLLTHEAGRSPIALGLEMERAEGDMAVPGRLKADVEAVVTQLGDANVDVSVVAADGKSLMTNPFDSEEWVPIPGGQALDELFDPHSGTVSALRAATNQVVTGAERIGDTDTWRVTATLDGGDLSAFAPIAEAGHPVQATLWVGKDEPLVHRVRLEGELGPDDSEGVIRVVELSRFDQPVTIALPEE